MIAEASSRYITSEGLLLSSPVCTLWRSDSNKEKELKYRQKQALYSIEKNGGKTTGLSTQECYIFLHRSENAPCPLLRTSFILLLQFSISAFRLPEEGDDGVVGGLGRVVGVEEERVITLAPGVLRELLVRVLGLAWG
jgi:hypothetical protein